MKTKLTNPTLSLLLGLIATPIICAADPVPVTADNFNRAESHMYFNNSVKGGGSASSILSAWCCRSTTRQ